jgi:hypothetical protein
MLRPVPRLAAGGQVAASSTGGAAPDLLDRGEMRGAVPRRAEGPLSRKWEWIHVSGGGIGPSSTGGVAALPRRLCGYAA